MVQESQITNKLLAYRKDWNLFAREIFGVVLDSEQQAILSAVQHNKRVSVRSGTARGKDFVSAVAAMCFLYLTPKIKNGVVVENTKVALTAPTGRQVENIMMPEISRLYNRAEKRGCKLPGRLTNLRITMPSKEWFLVGFKADDNNHEAWSGFHASHVMFVVTEATGISEDTFAAIEGNLQGDSRILLAFNPNVTTGYAARTHASPHWHAFRLNDLTAPNVVAKRTILSGQVDYAWVKEHVDIWCQKINQNDARESENDFEFEGLWYRPNDLFRIKVLGEFPKVADDVLVPPKWVELAQERWTTNDNSNHVVIGADIAGMGRDSTCFCYRQDNRVIAIKKHNSAGKADHMAIAGELVHYLQSHTACAVSIDTIGEGAGVYSRCVELLGDSDVFSCKFSASAKGTADEELHDVTGEYTFANLKAYLYWCVRDWLNPDNGNDAMLPMGGSLAEELANVKWAFNSNGKIQIESKETTKERLGHSPDELDALANTFYPHAVLAVSNNGRQQGLDDNELEQMFY